MTTKIHDTIQHLLACLDRKEIPADGLPYAEGLYALNLDYSPKSLERLDAFLEGLHKQGENPNTIMGQPGGMSFIIIFAAYLLEIVVRRTGQSVSWYNYPEAVQILPTDYNLPQEFFSSIVGIIANNVCLPLAALSDILNGRNSKACVDYVEERCDVISDKATDDMNRWCEEYLEKLRNKEYIPGGNAYREAMDLIAFDDSLRSLEEIDVLLKAIKQQEKLDVNNYGAFVSDREKTNGLLAIAFYLGMTAAKHAQVPVKWLSCREYLQAIGEPDLPYKFEGHAVCRLGATYYFPIQLLTTILFDPNPHGQSCLRFVKDVLAKFPQPQLMYFERKAYLDVPAVISDLLRQAMKDAGTLAAFSLDTASDCDDFPPTRLERHGEKVIMAAVMAEDAVSAVLKDMDKPPLDGAPFLCFAYGIYANLPTGRLDAVSIEVRSYRDEPFRISLLVPYRKKDRSHKFTIYSAILQDQPSLPGHVLAAAFAAFYEGAFAFIAPETGTSWWASCFVDKSLLPLDTTPAAATFLSEQERRFRAVLSKRKKSLVEKQQGDETENTQAALDDLANIGFPKPIQTLPRELRPYLQVVPPAWMRKDPLYAQILAMPKLYQSGKVVWAAVIQANSLMFQPEGDSCPGEIIYDPDGKTGPAELVEAAHRLFLLKGTTPAEPDQLAIAQHLTNERTRLKFFPFPTSIAPLSLRMSSVWFWRMHLPDGMLTISYFPVIISSECPGDVIVLPALFWPSVFKQHWMELSRQRHDGNFFDLESIALSKLKSGKSELPAALLEPPLAAIFAASPTAETGVTKPGQRELLTDSLVAEKLYESARVVLENPVVSASAKQDAILQLKVSADKGHRNALLQLAHIYGEGRIVAQNERLALDYLLKLAQLGDKDACVAAASFYLQGKGCAVNVVEARRWLKVAAALGHSDATQLLARLEEAAAGDAGQPGLRSISWGKCFAVALVLLALLVILLLI